MVFFKQRFKVGDIVYIRNPLTTYKDDENKRWVKGVVDYAHPAFGWCNVKVNGVTYGVWNNEILSESEYTTQREKIRDGLLSRIHFRPPNDGAVAY